MHAIMHAGECVFASTHVHSATGATCQKIMTDLSARHAATPTNIHILPLSLALTNTHTHLTHTHTRAHTHTQTQAEFLAEQEKMETHSLLSEAEQARAAAACLPACLPACRSGACLLACVCAACLPACLRGLLGGRSSLPVFAALAAARHLR